MAQDTAAAGNGGTADASANGGVVLIDDVNSGFNGGAGFESGEEGSDDSGSEDEGSGDEGGSDDGGISVGDVFDGSIAIDGGDVSTSTSLDISADGGTAISDASGGDGNFAFVS